MKQSRVQDIVKVMPSILKNFTGYIKDSFDKNGQETIDDANGVVGILIKLFAKEYIDDYFSKKTDNKLENFGLAVYLQASLIQIGKSITEIEIEHEIGEVGVKSISDLVQNLVGEQTDSFDTENILTIFQPKYHPIVKFTKESGEKILIELGYHDTIYKSFLKHFNDNIESTIMNTFGEGDYKKHKENISRFIVSEREAKLLSDVFELKKIGFKEDENLKYEETYGSWTRVSNLLSSSQSNEYEIQAHESIGQDTKELLLVEDLIEEYYISKDSIGLREIAFIVADFGKGKSVFLKNYASKLAKEYIETAEGFFPIYFNLRNFKNYQSNRTCGVIADFLLKEYGIEITSEEYKNKKYIFLIDSLDESGDLNKNSIDDVISSINEIQNIDAEHSRENRVIISSRPFEDGLDTQIKSCIPYICKDKHPYFISVHGFKEEQFNDWIRNSLKDYLSKADIQTNRFTRKIVDSVKNDKDIDIYALLIKNKTLTKEELKRPIFAYMIYQLIINNIDFSTIGKTGVYLSFLNLLTKEAKHIDDNECEYNLQDEIESRNILHAISALWMYERQQGRHGTLKKADIFRVLKGKKISEDDKKVLDENIGNEASDIKFLSHSYFGVNDDLIHFQHQSFAEMLLAEYYLKIFIKFALDDGDIEDARVYLNLGEPTEQTISFFKELLQLLKDSCSDNEKEKRKLLFPLLASLATEKHNKNVICNSLYYEWLKPMKLDTLSANSDNLVNNWCIDDEKLEKIINLSKSILESKKEYLSTKSNVHNALFDGEVVEIESGKLNRLPHNIDKWFALLVGNILKNNEPNRIFFNSYIENPKVLFEMMRDWNYRYNTAAPKWAGDYFLGIDTSKSMQDYEILGIQLENIDFSFSVFNRFTFEKSYIYNSKFNNCSFTEVNMRTDVLNSVFHNIIKLENSMIDFTNKCLSKSLLRKFYHQNHGYGSSIMDNASISRKIEVFWKDNPTKDFDENEQTFLKTFEMQKGFFIYGLKENKFTVEDIIEAYEYDSDETKEIFSAKVQELESEL
ncbi:NACHT domain-containing protein [Sulfurimonas sp. SAG-AH-194-C21]|nr:NACHT domain-containing protein [Sulfurimonas sp. SAG-AH-194-C21]MDF1883962.1 NACHT domain-containing protein [Sulfurimonas sp. SAG-AH-194-C21]